MYILKNNFYVETDGVNSNIEAGFCGKKNDKSVLVYLDEVEDIYNNKECDDNLQKDENGKFYLKSSYLSYRTIGSIVNGIPSKFLKEDIKAYNYFKKKGLIDENGMDVKYCSGIKKIKINDDLAEFTFCINKENINIKDIEYLKEICLGVLKKNIVKKSIFYKLECNDIKNIVFDKNKLEIKFICCSNKIFNTNEMFRELDIVLQIMFNKHYNRFDLISTAVSLVKDIGQEHYLRHDFGEKYSSFSKLKLEGERK